jgi:hypothetical protein
MTGLPRIIFIEYHAVIVGNDLGILDFSIQSLIVVGFGNRLMKWFYAVIVADFGCSQV